MDKALRTWFTPHAVESRGDPGGRPGSAAEAEAEGTPPRRPRTTFLHP
jgi:hypothetical protein